MEEKKSLWEKVKEVAIKFKNWLLENWFILVNYLVIFISYSIVYDKPGFSFAELLLGLWLFVSAAYGGFKWFNKK